MTICLCSPTVTIVEAMVQTSITRFFVVRSVLHDVKSGQYESENSRQDTLQGKSIKYHDIKHNPPFVFVFSI